MIKIVIDSACDLTPLEAESRGITLLPLTVTFGETSYRDAFDLTHDEFFEKLIESDLLPVTSLISPYAYQEAFDRLTGQGHEVLCLTVSAKLSGCYQSAMIASEAYTGSVSVIDTESACIGQRILAERALELIGKGLSLSELTQSLEKEKKDLRLIAMLDTLEYLKKGGRIPASAAVVGSVLNIKPVITIEEGAIKVLGVARGSKNVSNKLNEQVRRDGGIDYNRPLALAYSGLSDKLLQKYIKDSVHLYADYPKELPITTIGSAIGTHIGPGAIALCYFAG